MDHNVLLGESQVLEEIGQYEIKQEPDDAEFNLEDLHHSIDIKDECLSPEPDLDEKLDVEICRPFECYVCGSQFYEKSQLEKHLSTECLEKPFCCEICAFKCSRKLQLNRHMKSHIGEQTPESKEEEKRKKAEIRLEKEKLQVEINMGKTRDWINTSSFDDFSTRIPDDHDLQQNESEQFDTLIEPCDTYKLKEDFCNIPSTLCNKTDSESCIYISDSESVASIDDNKDQDFNVTEPIYPQNSIFETSCHSSTNECSKSISIETSIKPPSEKITDGSIDKGKFVRCKYCKNDISTKNFMRHLARHHKTEDEVRVIFKYPKNSSDRRRAFTLFRNDINFDLYIDGLTRPARRTMEDSNRNDAYYPCAYCKGLYLKNYLKRHVKACFVQKQSLNEKKVKNYLSHSQTVTACAMDPTDVISKLNVKEIFNSMKCDEIAFAAKKDLLIAHFGESYLGKHQNDRIPHTCSNRMRELSRLLINFRKIMNRLDISFKDLLHPKNFDNVVSAAREVAGYDQVKNTFKAPSLAMHMGTSLKLACDELTHLILSQSKGYECDSPEDLKTWLENIEDFKSLVESRWHTELSAHAYKDLMEKKLNKPPLLSMVTDIKQLGDDPMPIEKTSEISLVPIIKHVEDHTKGFIDSSRNERPKRTKRRKIDFNESDDEVYKIKPSRKSWSNQEVMLLKEQFGLYIREEHYPSGEQIKTFIKNQKSSRTVPVIKAKLQHLIKLKNKNYLSL